MVCIGDDWAEDHHDVELVDDTGRRLARARLPEGLEGITRLHALIAEHAPAEWANLDPAEAAGTVRIGIETDRGPWVQALVAAGYQVYAINPMSVARYRERHSTSGAKSDAADAHVLAEIVRLDHAHHRPVAGDSDQAEAMKLLARSHQTLIFRPIPPAVAAAQCAAGVLPRRPARLRRADRSRHVGATGPGF
jgi:transposase